MSITPLYRDAKAPIRHEKRTGRVYAIAYDLRTEAVARLFGEGSTSPYGKIERALEAHGFKRQQGSLFYGNADTTSMTCAKAVLDMYERFPWFAEVVKDMRMLRVTENDDLMSILPNRLRFDVDRAA